MFVVYVFGVCVRVLVTGAGGFLGGFIVYELVRRGYDVIALDNMSRAGYGIELLRDLGIEVVVKDVRDDLSDVLGGVDTVVHAAAYVDVEESVREPDTYMDNNVVGTARLLKSCLRRGIHRFIFISSAAVYGDPKYLPIDEEHPLNPISPYGVSKVASELLIKSLSTTYRELKPTILRPFNIYGPGQNPSYAGVITKFAERLLRGQPPIIYGDGEQTRDFIYVTDVARAVVKVLESDASIGKTYNVGTGKPITINQLARLMMEVVGLNLRPIYEAPRPGDIRHSYASIEKIREEIGWEPIIELKEGIAKVIKWFRKFKRSYGLFRSS